MKVVHNPPKTEQRKLIAVINNLGAGVFLPKVGGGCVFISPTGLVSAEGFGSLEEVMKRYSSPPVYEGDEFSLVF